MIMEEGTVQYIEDMAHKLRLHALRMVYERRYGHIGGCFSLAEILSCLYFHFLRIDPQNPDWEERDRLILSKGHAAPIYYAALAERGYFSVKELDTFATGGSFLEGHPDMRAPGVDMSSGSLGMGLSVGVGMAMGAKLLGKGFLTYVILGDGEIQEGQVWEAMLVAVRYRLDNLIAIVDYNKHQLMDRIDRTLPLEPLREKWVAFNWEVFEADGHDVEALVDTIGRAIKVNGRPSVVIAHTVKGKGVSFMEGLPEWHNKVPTGEEYREAKAELSRKVFSNE